MLRPMRRRPLVAVLVFAVLAVAVLAVALLGGRRGGEDVAARVGDTEITETAVRRTVDRINAELEREGRETAPAGSEGADRLRRSALALLVYRERIEQGAARLGIEVSLDDVRARVGGGEEEAEEEGEGAETDALEAVRTQLLYERIFQKVTRDVRVPHAEVVAHRRAGADDETILQELLSERKQAAMRAWLARTERELPVRAG